MLNETVLIIIILTIINLAIFISFFILFRNFDNDTKEKELNIESVEEYEARIKKCKEVNENIKTAMLLGIKNIFN